MSCCKGANSHIFPTLFATNGLKWSRVGRSYNLQSTLQFQRFFAETQVCQGLPLLLGSKRLVAGSIPAGGAKTIRPAGAYARAARRIFIAFFPGGGKVPHIIASELTECVDFQCKSRETELCPYNGVNSI
jgi:hypothetical protein